MKLTFLSLIFCFSNLIPGYAQQSVVSAGGDFTGAGGTMSFSAGLPDFCFYETEHGNLQLGMQQAFFDSTPEEIPDELDVDDTTLSDGDNGCFNALQTITTGGDGKIFVVENGAMAELIAGNNIRMLPGTTVRPDGYLHARITTDGSFCETGTQYPPGELHLA